MSVPCSFLQHFKMTGHWAFQPLWNIPSGMVAQYPCHQGLSVPHRDPWELKQEVEQWELRGCQGRMHHIFARPFRGLTKPSVNLLCDKEPHSQAFTQEGGNDVHPEVRKCSQ